VNDRRNTIEGGLNELIDSQIVMGFYLVRNANYCSIIERS